jgi:nucleotide-binding universal stress UspA family protein
MDGSVTPRAEMAGQFARWANSHADIWKSHPVKGDIGIDSVVLSYAADAGADLMVMGGYGHSRFREFILGGMTRGILESMAVPVLMSH